MANIIDIRKFVDVNIKHHETAKLNTTRDTTVMFVDASSYSATTLLTGVVASSLEEARAALSLPSVSVSAESAYLRAYFANGGQKVFIQSIDYSTNDTAAKIIENVIAKLPDEYIVLAQPATGPMAASVRLRAVMVAMNADTSIYGIKRKLAVITSLTSDYLEVANCIECHTAHQAGACAAYLSKIDISKTNSIRDYDFTVLTNILADDLTNTELDDLMEKNINCALKLAGEVRVVGGNTLDGKDIVNEFVLIVLQQTVTEKVLKVLVSKVKGELGVAAIHTAIAQELGRYVENGYLATDRVWTDETLSVLYNEKSYIVIEQDTPLLLGYQIKVIPYAALSEADRLAHKAPPIYLVLATSYGIRHVTINGEVF